MIDSAVLHVLRTAKAYAALIGSLLTLLASVADIDTLPSWFPTALAFLTAFATWAIPNAAPEPVTPDEPVGDH